jgi:hypothetical protein
MDGIMRRLPYLFNAEAGQSRSGRGQEAIDSWRSVGTAVADLLAPLRLG